MIRMSVAEKAMFRKDIVKRIPILTTGVVDTKGNDWDDWKIAAVTHRCRELFLSFEKESGNQVMTSKQEQESFELLVNLKRKLLSMVAMGNNPRIVTSSISDDIADIAVDLFEIRSALIAINTPLIFTVTNKWREKYIGDHDMEDRCSLCNQILIKCVDLFNPYYAIKFSTFAVNSLKREVFRDQERCNNRKTRFRLKDDVEPSIKYKPALAHSSSGNMSEIYKLIDKFDSGTPIMKDERDEEIFKMLVSHLRAGGSVKTFEKEPGVPQGRVKEVLIRVRNQYK